MRIGASPIGRQAVGHSPARQPNPGEHERWVCELRLDPRMPETRLRNTHDLEALQNDAPDHIGAAELHPCCQTGVIGGPLRMPC